MLDIAGLIDVPLAQHKFAKPFLREYLFDEKRPHFAHVHGGWAGSSGIPRFPEFRSQYFEIPGYIANRREFHIGNHVRRDLVMGPVWPPPDGLPALGKVVRMDNGVGIHGIRVPSEPVRGGKLYVEIGMSLLAPVVPTGPLVSDTPASPQAKPEGARTRRQTRRRRRDEVAFRVWLVAERGAQQHLWELAPAYDWLFPDEWKEGEIFQGRYGLQLPEALSEGTYDLVVLVVQPDGTIATDRATEGPFSVAQGEIRYPRALTILSEPARRAARKEDRARALSAASDGRCDDAEHAFWLARRHSVDDRAWIEAAWPEVRRAFATCYAEASDAYEAPRDKVDTLVRAREWDHWAPAYRTRADEVADALIAMGKAARAVEDWERAYRNFSDAVAVDRSRAWARRWAEEARSFKLGIDDATLAEAKVKKREAVERRRSDRKRPAVKSTK